MENQIKKLGYTEIFKGKRVHLIKEQLLLPDGRETEWELILHPGASAVIPIDHEGKILMVRQYRNASDSTTLEIPAGTLDYYGEDPKGCAQRELHEETGYLSNDISFLFKFYSSIGITNEVIHIFVAKNLVLAEQNLDDDEFVSVERYSLEELMQLVMDGTIIDNKTISSLLMYKVKNQL